ncbi:MAG: flagellar brake protein [Burkholderiaceae bacterium]|jgi:c-di-GMP-binding flagellar brake protein YcgR|nr:flagellar brake protein [Burkholderiaceae bacterium]
MDTSSKKTGNAPHEAPERFLVRSRREISNIFERIRDNKQLIRMSFSGSLETVITSILEVNSQGGYVVLDRAPIDSQNALILKSHMVDFEALLEKIRISFSVDDIELCHFDGGDALKIPFPSRLVRLQRREFFRVPVRNSVIRIPVSSGENMELSVGAVRDLSANGACVIDASMQIDGTVGTVYRGCRLELLDTQPIVVDLEIRNAYNVHLSDKTVQRRIGCQFIDMNSSEAALIQRYITRIERNLRALTG